MSGTGGGTVRGILGRDPVHPFPARMAPEIALDVISGCRESLRVLDPMCGSGTVLAVARSRGHRAVGVDLDPLAVLTSKVWTTTVDAELLREQAATALSRARYLFGSVRTRDAYPPNADAETQRFVRYWFDPYARRQLSALALAIQEVQNDETRNALLCAFSRLIITKQSGASLAMDLSHSRPHRAFTRAPAEPFSKFLFAVDRVAKGCVDGNVRSPGPAAYVHHGDARSLVLADDSIDLVLTSPPYLNAIDYFRCSKFSLIWMGYSIRELRQARAVAVGTEVGKDAGNDRELQGILAALELKPRLPARQEAVLVRYIDDMRGVVGEAARVLAAGGKAVFVVGENTLRGTFIPSSQMVEQVANVAGLWRTDRRSRELPPNRRYLPPPLTQSKPAALNARMRREVILTFEKAA